MCTRCAHTRFSRIEVFPVPTNMGAPIRACFVCVTTVFECAGYLHPRCSGLQIVACLCHGCAICGLCGGCQDSCRSRVGEFCPRVVAGMKRHGKKNELFVCPLGGHGCCKGDFQTGIHSLVSECATWCNFMYVTMCASRLPYSGYTYVQGWLSLFVLLVCVRVLTTTQHLHVDTPVPGDIEQSALRKMLTPRPWLPGNGISQGEKVISLHHSMGCRPCQCFLHLSVVGRGRCVAHLLWWSYSCGVSTIVSESCNCALSVCVWVTLRPHSLHAPNLPAVSKAAQVVPASGNIGDPRRVVRVGGPCTKSVNLQAPEMPQAGR